MDTTSPVVGTSSIVGFAHGYNNNNHSNDRSDYHNYGISDKDQGYQASIDAGERTRDVLFGQRHSDKLTTDGTYALAVAIEKIGAASVLVSEKNTAELRVQSERIRADQASQAERLHLASTLALSDVRLEQQKQACEIEAKIAACCCKLEAQMLAIDANRIRDDLAQVRAELLAAQR